MIEIDHTLLSEEVLDNLIVEIITRQGTDYGDHEVAIETKKKQLTTKLRAGDAVIVYSLAEETCDIIPKEDFKMFKNINPDDR